MQNTTSTIPLWARQAVPAVSVPAPIPTTDLKFKVLDLLCQADSALAEIVAAESGTGAHALPIIERGSIQHHVVALAGYLKRTSATSITASFGGVIVTARKSR